jgi:hypothetical protein
MTEAPESSKSASGPEAVIRPHEDRIYLVSWAAFKITFVLTMVIGAGWLAYSWGHRAPDWFDSMAWFFAFGGWVVLPLLLLLLCLPAVFVSVGAAKLDRTLSIRQ